MSSAGVDATSKGTLPDDSSSTISAAPPSAAATASGKFGVPTTSLALGNMLASSSNTPPAIHMSLEEGSSATSHASSSRLGNPNTALPSTTRQQYQPLSLADVLTRANQDPTRALDEVLAERNKLCLENTKLGTENVRIWNLIRRIKKENEEWKASSSKSALVASHSTPISSTVAQSSTLPPTVTTSNSTGLVQEVYETPSLFRSSNNQAGNSSRGSPLSAPSANAATNYGNGGRQSKSSDQTSLLTMNSFANSPLSTSVSSPPETTQSTHDSLQHDSGATTANDQLSGDPFSLSKASPSTQQSSSLQHLMQSPQQTSIMQQRAAARAQGLAVMTSPRAEGNGSARNSLESHDFEAIDGSSVANSDEDDRSEAASEDANRRQQQSSSMPISTNSGYEETIRRSSKGQTATYTDALGLTTSLSPRLDAKMLPYVNISVVGTNLRSNDRGREDVSFYIAVDLKAPPNYIKSNPSTWRVEKSHSDILALDARLKQKHGKNKTAGKRISSVQLPDRTLFKDHAPSKVDQRKVSR
jgi:RalA-binding protein 1